MVFEFQLHQPPCDVAFLAVVNGPVFYNAEGATTETLKEAMIRHIGWHKLHLPKEWFFSERSREMTERVCHTMQCTIQYLAYRQKRLETEAANTQRKLEEMQEERDKGIEELVKLRELTALMKKRYGASGTSKTVTKAPRISSSSVDITGWRLACHLCGNCYPSPSSLESHLLKRHHRGTHHATLTTAPVVVQHQDIEGVNATNTLVTKELASLRADVTTINKAIAAGWEKKQIEAGPSSLLSPINVVALPAYYVSGQTSGTRDGTSLLLRQQNEKLVEKLQDELQLTKSRLARMEQTVRRQSKQRSGRRREIRSSTNSKLSCVLYSKDDPSEPAKKRNCCPVSYTSESLAPSFVFYGVRSAKEEQVGTNISNKEETVSDVDQAEALDATHAVRLPHYRTTLIASKQSSSSSSSSSSFVAPVSPLCKEISNPSLFNEYRPRLSESPPNQTEHTVSNVKAMVPNTEEASMDSIAEHGTPLRGSRATFAQNTKIETTRCVNLSNAGDFRAGFLRGKLMQDQVHTDQSSEGKLYVRSIRDGDWVEAVSLQSQKLEPSSFFLSSGNSQGAVSAPRAYNGFLVQNSIEPGSCSYESAVQLSDKVTASSFPNNDHNIYNKEDMAPPSFASVSGQLPGEGNTNVLGSPRNGVGDVSPKTTTKKKSFLTKLFEKRKK